MHDNKKVVVEEVCMMKIFSWNVRGLGGVEKKKEVRKLVEEKGLSILCLHETKLTIHNTFYVARYGAVRLILILFILQWGN